MANEQILTWYGRNESWTKELRELIAKKDPSGFVTMRLGTKWADRLNPGTRIALSISDNPQQPNVIGHARVRTAKKGVIRMLDTVELTNNIGANTREGVLAAMQEVYQDPAINMDSTITVLDLVPE